MIKLSEGINIAVDIVEGKEVKGVSMTMYNNMVLNWLLELSMLKKIFDETDTSVQDFIETEKTFMN